jgi:hypothetical protein
VGKFSERDIKDTLSRVVSGQLQTHALDKVSFEDRDCDEFYLSVAEAQVSEDDEVLRETLEELRKKRDELGEDSTKSSKRGRKKRRSKDEL